MQEVDRELICVYMLTYNLSSETFQRAIEAFLERFTAYTEKSSFNYTLAGAMIMFCVAIKAVDLIPDCGY